MAVIVPTVTAGNAHAFRSQMLNIEKFTQRVHLDLMSLDFTPHKSVDISEIWWPDNFIADIHIMFKNPLEQLEILKELKPSLVVVHAEAEGNFSELADELHAAGIKVGLALLKQTHVSVIEPALDQVDHVLIFSGDLGSFGGHADLDLLDKVKAIKVINPNIEVGWDGGVNEESATRLAVGGVDVLNVGGFIQRSENPHEAYAKLEKLVQGVVNGQKNDN